VSRQQFNPADARKWSRQISGVELQFDDHHFMKILIVILLLIIAVVSVGSLLSGASFLGVVVPGGLPLGNALAASGLAAPAAFALLLSSSAPILRVAALWVLWAALAWLPTSIVLAGNLALNFSDWRGPVWIGFSLVVALAVLCTLIWSIVHWLSLLRRRANAA
jgi:hypothetical protein